MKLFFDTSAFAKRYIEEFGSRQIQDFCHEATALGLSVLTLPELISTLNRLKREKKITNKQYQSIKSEILIDFEDIEICSLTPSVIKQAIQLLEKNILRTLDSLQVASAIEWGAEMFISADHRQLLAAKKAGLTIKEV